MNLQNWQKVKMILFKMTLLISTRCPVDRVYGLPMYAAKDFKYRYPKLETSDSGRLAVAGDAAQKHARIFRPLGAIKIIRPLRGSNSTPFEGCRGQCFYHERRSRKQLFSAAVPTHRDGSHAK
jgi:hypothetical protein